MKTAINERAVEAALWWRNLRETNNATFLPLFFDESRYLVLCGGGGSGKSIFAGRKVLERCVSEAGHRFLVCRKVARTLRESCYRQLVGQAREFYDRDVAQVYLGEMRIVFKNGSEILFAGLDDVEKLKSIYNITSIWIEEASELLESDFNQLDIRLRGKKVNYQQIILSFNPVSILHWLKLRFFDGSADVGAQRRLEFPATENRTHEVRRHFRKGDENGAGGAPNEGVTGSADVGLPRDLEPAQTKKQAGEDSGIFRGAGERGGRSKPNEGVTGSADVGLPRDLEPAPSARTHRSTYKDNRFLPEENAAVLEAFRHTDEYYYTVYCLGEWGVLGKSVFDAKAVTARIRENVQPVRVGYFGRSSDKGTVTPSQTAKQSPLSSGAARGAADWIDDGTGGFIKIYAEPVEGRPYVIGADTAGEGSDRFVAQVIDNTNGNQVAVLRQKMDEDLFAKQLCALGHFYNTALIGVETNFSTYPIMELERLGYPRQYVRETVDDFTHKSKQSFGFRTDSKTRPIIIAELIRAVRDDIGIVCDKDTLEEMLTFVRNEAFRAEAEAGAHDDCVMALAIAHHIRPQQRYLPERERAERVKWREDQWEDYKNADAAARRMLVERWGDPWGQRSASGRA